MKSPEILQTTIRIGLKKPVRFLHVTDSHISLADERDNADLRWLAEARAKEFDGGEPGSAVQLYREISDYARKRNLFVVHTGDLIDFLSQANFDFLDRAFDGVDYLYAAGNHDFCHFVGRATEDAAYKRENRKKTAPHLRSNLHFDSHVLGGVNLVALDDSYYLIDDGQTEMLRAEAAKGLPMVLCMHAPLYTPRCAEKRLAENPCAYLVAPPADVSARYPEDRRLQQTPDEATLRAVDYIKSEPLIKAIIAGHTHQNEEEPLENGIPQYTTGASYRGFAREICLL